MDSQLKETLRQSTAYVRQPFWMEANAPIFIYGTGSVAQEVHRVLTIKGLHLTGFMDHRLGEISDLNGAKIFQPNNEQITSEERLKAKIVLAIHNREVHIPSLIEKLKTLGYSQFISMIDLSDFFAEQLGARYWLTSRTFYQSHQSDIETIYNLWSDEVSRAVYSSLLRFRITGDFALLPTPDIQHQYFPTDLPIWTQPLRLVDCGAYDGDAISAFLNAGIKIDALAAFEPDLNNYKCLSQFADENSRNIHEISVWPCGVYSETIQLRFDAYQGEASSISSKGENTIQCIALDDALPNFAPTLIKMDIEGAEFDALLGARHLIATYRPGLAISVYHTPAHLWEIPLLVNQMAHENNISYTYRLRAHGHNCFDTVFYAIHNPR